MPPSARTARRRRARRINILAVALLAGAASLVAVVGVSPAEAVYPATIRVTIDRIEELGCTDTFDGSDFYGHVIIDGHQTDFGEITDQDEVSPTNWVAQQDVDTDITTSVPVTIAIADSDGFLNFDDNACDLNGSPGNDLHFTVDTATCGISGDVTGSCDATIESSGLADESARVKFRVEVIQAPRPQTATDALVRCTQSPLWPQPGDNVTITAEALDPALHVGDTLPNESDGPGTAPALVNRAVLADRIEIWVGDRTAADKVEVNANTATFTVNNVAAGDLLYACKVASKGSESFTGWRRTRVGAPAEGKAIPILLTGSRKSRVDVVLIANQADYTGPGDPAFQTAVSNVLKGAFFGEGYFLRLQEGFNFWLADSTANAQGVVADKCTKTNPANWSTDYAWADTGAILHAAFFRDCAGNGTYSSEPSSLGTVLHETGHAPFGLPDEYCCDGGYWENTPNATMYDTQAECQADAPNIGRTAGDCFSIVDTRPDPDNTWWVADPTPSDLMNSRTPPNGGDMRRITWFFAQCLDGKC